jgi:hypothetical protein
MILIPLSFAICITALTLLIRRKPNLYAFHLVERVFGDLPYRKKTQKKMI